MRSDFTLFRSRRQLRRRLGTAGAAAVELGLALPFLVLLVIGIIDFGTYLDGSQAIAAATRIGAEFALDDPNACKPGIQPSSGTPISAACITGIEDAMQNAANFTPALTFPNAPFLTCQCQSTATPATYKAIACNQSCFTNPPAGFTGPNRVFITVSASQAYSPIIPWLPTVVNGITVVRRQ